MDTAGKSIGDRRPLLYLRLLTRRVNDQLGQICSHSSLIRRFGHSAQPPTAGFRLKRSSSTRYYHAGSAPTRQSGDAAAVAQLAQEARPRAEILGNLGISTHVGGHLSRATVLNQLAN